MKDDIQVTTVKSLRDCGKDEYWLQEKIYEDPSILGLGKLDRVSIEQVQSSGGRLDLLLKDPGDDSMYEVEIMLGETDADHIIRTIEYWDLERRRWPKRSHTAVLVAEGINTRFFNVVQLLSQAVPIIGIQVSAIQLNGNLGLHFTTMINSFEEEVDKVESPQVDEAYWKNEAPQTLAFARTYEPLVKSFFDNVTLRFCKSYLTLTISALDRIWIWPAKAGLIWVQYRLEEKGIEALKNALVLKGFEPKITYGEYLKVRVENNSLDTYLEDHKNLLQGIYAKDLKRKNP